LRHLQGASTLDGVPKNLVNASDVAWLATRLLRPAELARVKRRGQDRVLATWNRVGSSGTHWFDLDVVVEHRLARAANGEGKDHVDRVLATYLRDSRDLLALSVGCGTGQKELHWAQTGVFSRIDAFDLASERIAEAQRAAEETRLPVNFFVGDLFELALPDSYDVVIFEDALHHLSPLGVALDRVASALKPGGLLVVHDYIGPSRFQWSKSRQVVINGLLTALPEDYRRRPDGSVKRRVQTPSWLRMKLKDPSEAPESDRIMAELASRFEMLETTPLGGGIVCPLLDEIAGNFSDEEGERLLTALLELEDRLVDAGEPFNDYVLAVARRRREAD
jgi:SAM-dependent methyltransferase